MWHGDFAVLVAALLFVGNLIFDLQSACASFNHFLSQKICGLGVAKACIYVGNNGYDMRFVVLDFGHGGRFARRIILAAGVVEITEQNVEFAAISLAQERIKFFNER